MAKRVRAEQAFLPLILLAGFSPLAAHDALPLPRTVSVSGEGEVAAEPDRARLSLGVDQLSPDIKTAENAVNKVVRSYVAEAKKLGAAAKDVQTTGISIQPEYQWDNKLRERKLLGYRVRRDIVVLVTDLDRLGDFILRATDAGVNNVNAPVLESSKAKDLENEALTAATEDARARARLLADTLDVKLGPVRTLSASQSFAPPPVMMKSMAMRAEADGNSEMGISLGEIRYRATVQAEFDLLP